VLTAFDTKTAKKFLLHGGELNVTGLAEEGFMQIIHIMNKMLW
jgi:hypothetical protein